MTPSVAIVVPFRSNDPDRLRICDWVSRRWQALHPDWPLVLSDDGETSGPFNRSRAVNRGVRSTDADVVVVADADIAVRHGQAEAMVEALAACEPWVVGYRRMVHLMARPTAEALAKDPAMQIADPIPNRVIRYQSRASVCGLLALRRGDFGNVGGFDARFRSWGVEDVAFAAKCDTLLGPHERIPGDVAHLFHALRPDRKTDAHAIANQALGARYDEAIGDADAMTALVREALNVAAW